MESNLNNFRAQQILGLYGEKPKQSRKAEDKDENNDAIKNVVLNASADKQPDITVIDSALNLSTQVEKSEDETDDGMTTDAAQ